MLQEFDKCDWPKGVCIYMNNEVSYISAFREEQMSH